jgi:hypothetical protein
LVGLLISWGSEKIAGEEQVGIFYHPGNAASYSDIAG